MVRTMTATITDIDKSASSITFVGPNGWKYSRRVVDPTVFDQVKVGDRVDITWNTDVTVAVRVAPGTGARSYGRETPSPSGSTSCFATLIVPPLATRRMTRRRLAATWSLGLAGYAVGLVTSTTLDLPTGPVIVWVLVALALVRQAATRPRQAAVASANLVGLDETELR